MDVAITGGAGFIGANLAGALGRARRSVGVVVSTTSPRACASNLDGVDVRRSSRARSSTPPPSTRPSRAPTPSCTWPPGRRCPARSTIPWPSHEVNATGTFEVLEAVRRAGGRRTCRGVVVVASTAPTRRSPSTRTCADPAAEPVRREQAGHRGVRAGLAATPTGCRCSPSGSSTSSGRSSPPATPTPRWCRPSSTPRSRGQPLPVHGDGQQSRDFTYVGTVAAVLTDARAAAGRRPGPGQPGLRQPHRRCSS